VAVQAPRANDGPYLNESGLLKYVRHQGARPGYAATVHGRRNKQLEADASVIRERMARARFISKLQPPGCFRAAIQYSTIKHRYPHQFGYGVLCSAGLRVFVRAYI
jgi:hypothetical protein